ncbi:WD40 repeat protein [Saccharopolyspora gloriosae]|uniref:WD40 repeat protein n=1 Tax=Saccharopolyspora gloriosae TaxID=455344 RepID=A0A840NIZ6_9PSEU|nr:WD40 repeat protein [Saccharopolyspora gloriosae]
MQAGNVGGDITLNIGAPTSLTSTGVVPTPPNRVVPRPELSDRLVDKLLSDEDDDVVALVGVAGAGGFGKTTLAAAVCRQERVLRQFPDGVLWVTLGEQVQEADLAGKINDLTVRVSGHRPLLTDPEQAGQHLGAILDNAECLLVVDDVWRASQLAPFLHGGRSCRRLVTTRMRDVLPTGTAQVAVDAMTPQQARTVLSEGLPASSDKAWEPLLARTGGWPVLMTLANRAVRKYLQRGLPVPEATKRVGDRLAAKGPTALDITNANQRSLAVAATVEVSLSLLAEENHHLLERFLELAVFPEDAVIPQRTLEVFWGHTAGLDDDDVEQLCMQLDDLSLVQGYSLNATPRLQLHDVIGDYLRHRAGLRLTYYHRSLLDAHRAELTRTNGTTAWWELPRSEPYLWRTLSHHLHHADRNEELDTTVCNIRWLLAVLHRDGPAAVENDLAHVNAPLGAALRRVITQNAHLLAPVEPDNALAATLLSRLHGYSDLTDYVAAAITAVPGPYLSSVWPLPDTPHPALQRVLTGHPEPVITTAISPDGTWLATGSEDGTVRLWSAEGASIATLHGHSHSVMAVVISPDGTWLASASSDRTIRLWEGDGTPIGALTGHTRGVMAVAISPDSTWLATGSEDRTVRLWSAEGAPIATLHGHSHAVTAVSISPDGTWLAAGSHYGAVRTWSSDGSHLATLTGHTGRVTAVSISPDGTWLATSSYDGSVRRWSSDGSHLATLTGHTDWVTAVSISPDGTWLATSSYDGSVRRWSSDGTHLATLTGHTGKVTAVSISFDGTWLVTGSEDCTVRRWTVGGTETATLTSHTSTITTMAISPDGNWLATGSDEGTVYRWANNGSLVATLTGHTGKVTAVSISLDGTWLVTGSEDCTVRRWTVGGTETATLTSHTSTITTMAISPDGNWLATGSEDRTVRLWSSDGAPIAALTDHTDAVTAVAISPDGTWLATASRDRTVRLWESDGTPIAILTGHFNGVTSVAISPDGTWLASGSNDRSARLWHREGNHIATLTGHTKRVTTVKISPDSRWLATGSDDGTVRRWASDGTPISTVADHSSRVTALEISPDDSWLASTGHDRIVRLWSQKKDMCVSALRVDADPVGAGWLPGSSECAVAGTAGPYVFRIIT